MGQTLKSCVVPIMDMHRDGLIVFEFVFYGVDASAVCSIPIGAYEESNPPDIGSIIIVRALRRRRLDPDRYRASIWDVRPNLNSYSRLPETRHYSRHYYRPRRVT